MFLLTDDEDVYKQIPAYKAILTKAVNDVYGWVDAFLAQAYTVGTPDIRMKLQQNETELVMAGIYESTLNAMDSRYAAKNAQATVDAIVASKKSERRRRDSTPLYTMIGHGEELELDTSLRVPRGCTLVVLGMHGMVSVVSTLCRLMELFSRRDSEKYLANMMDIKNREWLHRTVGLAKSSSVHVYTAGTTPPNLVFNPGVKGSVSGLQRFPLKQMRTGDKYNPAQSCDSHVMFPESPVFTPGQMIMSFENSTFPSLERVYTKFNGQGGEVMTRIGRYYRAGVVPLMQKFGPGVFYFSSCRAGDLWDDIGFKYGMDFNPTGKDLFDLTDFMRKGRRVPASLQEKLLRWQGEVFDEEHEQASIPGIDRRTRKRGPSDVIPAPPPFS